MDNIKALELKNITKTFGEVVANKDVNLEVYRGEILSLLGENGSGKTTLMNMLSGIYYPDEGHIFVNGEPAAIRSPRDAYHYKIGMVHQHFKLVDIFSGVDNIILGEKLKELPYKEEKAAMKAEGKNVAALPFLRLGRRIKFNYLARNRGKAIQAIADKYGFEVDLKKKIYDMSVSEKQTVEIIKVLYRGADILILDEPTAVLTPQETEKLFDVMRAMKADGKSLIIITHKLNEVMAISDRVAVLRKGEHVATVNTAETNEKELTEMMVGKKVDLNIERSVPVDSVDRLAVKELTVVNREGVKALDNVSFTARSGEILGIAGIAGSGQRELLEAIAGLQKTEGGDILYFDPYKNDAEVDLKKKTPMEIRDLGVRLSFVPEDRLGMGLVGNMDIIDNMMLRSYSKGPLMFLDRKNPKHLADEIIEELEVVTPSSHTPVRRLSGGNVQKVLVGREIAAAPTVLMAAYPVRGLDINSSYTIYNLLNEQKKKGVAVIYVGEDLDVLIDLCDRILVLCAGKVSGIVDGRNVTKEEIGLLMTAHSANGEHSAIGKTETKADIEVAVDDKTVAEIDVNESECVNSEPTEETCGSESVKEDAANVEPVSEETAERVKELMRSVRNSRTPYFTEKKGEAKVRQMPVKKEVTPAVKEEVSEIPVAEEGAVNAGNAGSVADAETESAVSLPEADFAPEKGEKAEAKAKPAKSKKKNSGAVKRASRADRKSGGKKEA
ncbi:MAG: ABC transporter ATP-binding protein [Firmicutes bacterium]|uniref:ABC transporter ATP-binding protein n=1 Tax=Candidatus Stercoripulliclostridium pullicola TaxID=2840953 RepID=A0A940ICT1_9FIRM|nr:ABC transporter ATP-binding protein [Candidatus Stercoripulliclostridium pullicola]